MLQKMLRGYSFSIVLCLNFLKCWLFEEYVMLLWHSFMRVKVFYKLDESTLAIAIQLSKESGALTWVILALESASNQEKTKGKAIYSFAILSIIFFLVTWSSYFILFYFFAGVSLRRSCDIVEEWSWRRVAFLLAIRYRPFSGYFFFCMKINWYGIKPLFLMDTANFLVMFNFHTLTFSCFHAYFSSPIIHEQDGEKTV